MVRALFTFIFGCRHRALSWPLTIRQPRKRTYVVCLSCGTELDYDFEAMQLCRPARMKVSTNALHGYAD
jgi:hypothetical protein